MPTPVFNGLETQVTGFNEQQTQELPSEAQQDH